MGLKVLCLAFVCIYPAEGEASGADLLPTPPSTQMQLVCVQRNQEMRQGLLIGQRKRTQILPDSTIWLSNTANQRFTQSRGQETSGGVKGCNQSDKVRSKATWNSTVSKSRPLPFAEGDKSQFSTYLDVNQHRSGAERSPSIVEVRGLCRCTKTSTKNKVQTNQLGIICFRVHKISTQFNAHFMLEKG